MQIGSFTPVSGGFVGRLKTLTLDVPLRIVPAAEGGTEKSPDWRALLDEDGAAVEVGAGWAHEGTNVGSYVTLQLDCPTFPRPIRANLLRSKTNASEYVLLWSPRLRRPKAE